MHKSQQRFILQYLNTQEDVSVCIQKMYRHPSLGGGDPNPKGMEAHQIIRATSHRNQEP